MNKTKIEWCDYTWNPVTGCLHGCPYCYARRIARRFGKPEDLSGCEARLEANFTPTFYPGRIEEPKKVKRPSRIFTVSMGDLFGGWVPAQWINTVLQTVRECPQHTFIFLSKNPARYEECEWPANCWVGVTVENSYAATRLVYIAKIKAAVRFVSFEPLLGPVEISDLANLKDLHWVIIGAQTGPGAKPPAPGWVKKIIGQARAADIPIFLKNNLKWSEAIQEWPA